MNTPLQGKINVDDKNIIANICLKINRKELKTEQMFCFCGEIYIIAIDPER